jgi:hypothetical protein
VGLWQDSICSDLLWSTKQGSHILPRLPGNRAPSWSWISVHGPVAIDINLTRFADLRRASYIVEYLERGPTPEDPEVLFGYV